MHSSTKKAAEPKRLTKNGKVYGDLLSAEEKKKLVLQKKKDKKQRKSANRRSRTIPLCGDVPRRHLQGQQPPLTQRPSVSTTSPTSSPRTRQDGHLRELVRLFDYFVSSIFVPVLFHQPEDEHQRVQEQINIPEQDDEFNDIRSEYSEMLQNSSRRATTASSSASTLLLALRPTPCAWRRPSWIGLRRTSSTNFKTLGVKTEPLSGYERLKVLHDVFNMTRTSRPLLL